MPPQPPTPPANAPAPVAGEAAARAAVDAPAGQDRWERWERRLSLANVAVQLIGGAILIALIDAYAINVWMAWRASDFAAATGHTPMLLVGVGVVATVGWLLLAAKTVRQMLTMR